MNRKTRMTTSINREFKYRFAFIIELQAEFRNFCRRCAIVRKVLSRNFIYLFLIAAINKKKTT